MRVPVIYGGSLNSKGPEGLEGVVAGSLLMPAECFEEFAGMIRDDPANLVLGRSDEYFVSDGIPVNFMGFIHFMERSFDRIYVIFEF